jgi:FG-GAP-like repeat/Abnormal spindle-like microcephaly-assoc'd, ASPM-SPD-2-Hydin
MKATQRRLTAALALCVAAFPVTASAQFETRGTFPLQPGSEPFAAAPGDFNHDGKLDTVLVDFFTVPGNVAVLLGNGDGTFRSPVYYSVENEPRSVAVGDFNRDGNLDLAVSGETSPGNGCISVLFGNGDGTFQPAVNLPLSAYSTFVAVADFNDDGIPDLLAADFPYISVLLGNGDGTFQPPINNDSFSPTPPDALGVGDFTGDGKLDVVVAGQFDASSQAVVLLGNGDGTFQTGATYTILDAPQTVAVADFRNIGKLDLAIGSYLFSEVGVLLGNGDGTFQGMVPYNTAGATDLVAVDDFNVDGKLDIATTEVGNTSSQVGILLGKGDGTFSAVTSYPGGRSDFSLAVGDFNGDHLPDIVAADAFYSTSSAMVLLNTGVVSFAPTTPVSFPSQLVGTRSSPHNVTLTNNGVTTLTISTMRIRGPFQLASGTTCGASVAPGAKCTLSFVFQPTAIGSSAGQLSISDSASTKPQVIELQGDGTMVSLSPAELDFGSQRVGTKSAVHNVTVTNTGSTAVTVTGVFIIGSAHRDYSETNTCGTQIGPGAGCTISVTFTPTQTGTRTALVEIVDSGGGTSQGVSLSGTGD